MPRLKIVHLVDDTTAGGVMRMLDFLMQNRELHADADQQMIRVNRRALSFGRIDADVIVSHLAISWRALPALVTLRAMHPTARLLHIEHSYTRSFTALNVTAKRRFFALLRVAYALFDTVIAVSQNQANWMLGRRLVSEASLQVIAPQVDLSGFEGLRAPSGPTRVIGAIGRLEPQKGFDILIEAFRKTSHLDARLVIFGDGNERERLEKLAQNDSRICFRGHAADPVAAYSEVDVVALPSRWEAYGIVAREALAAKRPIVAANVDGLADLSGTEARLVKGHTISDWAKALEDAFAAKLAAPTDASRSPDLQTYAEKWNTAFRGVPVRQVRSPRDQGQQLAAI